MKTFEAPDFEVVKIAASDVIVTSWSDCGGTGAASATPEIQI